MSPKRSQTVKNLGYIKGINAEYIEDLFEAYLRDPASIDETWRYFFDGLELGTEQAAHVGETNGHDSAEKTPALAPSLASITPLSSTPNIAIEAKVADLINAYRSLGRMLARINPLEEPPANHPLLDLARFGLSEADLGKTFTAGKVLGLGAATLTEILARLKQIYTGSIGVEYTHIQDTAIRQWLEQRMESTGNRETLSKDTKKFVLKRLVDTESFERFLHTRYVAQKRFSIEGGDATIPALDRLIETACELGANQFVFGMAHRGRLNVLTNLFGKKAENLFSEFEDNYDTVGPTGDVKYHKGYSADVTTAKGKNAHLSLAYNPSHLEFVNPVVEGIARAKQRFLKDKDGTQVVPILIHGDAAFAGQGVCYETLNLSQVPAYATGGTIHLLINNQVGFTTDPADARSSTYATDVAKMLEVPIFHVNGDDAEAVWFIAGLCAEFRQKFHKDIFIDLICYRKYGHNEGDEPAFTQPLLYRSIAAHASPREIYGRKLIQEGTVSEAEEKALVDQAMARLTEAQKITREKKPKPHGNSYEGMWKDFHAAKDNDVFTPVTTAVPAATLKVLSQKLNTFPSDFALHPKLGRFFDGRLKAVTDEKGIDWGNGESLAFASLLAEGTTVRITGQDAERGTFTHRQAIVRDFQTGKKLNPFSAVALPGSTAEFLIANSILSETAVMAFEYGWSLADPKALVIWEAQFGDFANGAQVIIDQFLASSEEKWGRASGLVLLLPHGYEGQGPEHSSARMERFLQLCAQNNLFVCNFTTPAQFFHALRRQVKFNFRKPMVVMTPKSLLRHPLAVSALEDFTQGTFQEVIPDTTVAPKTVKRIALCTGKVYYDLLAKRDGAQKTDGLALIRVEQLHPWPEKALTDVISKYPTNAEIVWVQEEPRNMGAWTFVYGQWAGGLGDFGKKIGGRLIRYIGRDSAASPAVGSLKRHVIEQEALIAETLRF